MRIPLHGGLRKSEEFSAVFGKGRSVADRALVLYWLPRDFGPPRVGFCVGKQLGKAVRRNRIKRLLRECWRKVALGAETPADLVFVARGGGVQFSLAEWIQSMQGLLGRAKLGGPGSGKS